MNIKDISDMRGLSGQILFAMDTKSVPGHCLCHYVRLETIAHPDKDEFNAVSVMALHPDSDRRLNHLARCFAGGAHEAAVALAKALILTTQTLENVLDNPVQAPSAIKAYKDIIAINKEIIRRHST